MDAGAVDAAGTADIVLEELGTGDEPGAGARGHQPAGAPREDACGDAHADLPAEEEDHPRGSGGSATGAAEPDAGACAAAGRASAPQTGGVPATRIEAAGAMPSWRASILDQVAARDRHTHGLVDLFEQYSECLHGLQTLRGGVAGPCGGLLSGDGSPEFSPRVPTPSGLPHEELPRAAAADSAHAGTVQEASRRLTHGLHLKDQELQALRQLLHEREEELQEKEQAHTALCRQATLLQRENSELKNQLERTQEQLQANASKIYWFMTELQRLREEKTAGQSGSACERVVTEPPVLPLQQRAFRKIHSGELTCIVAARMQCTPLPRTLVAIGTADGYVKLLDGDTIKLHAHLSVSRDFPRLVAVDLSPGTGMLLAASSDHAFRLLDLRAQHLLHTLRGHQGSISACGFLRGSAQAFTASADRTVKFWDLEKGEALRSIPTNGAVTSAGVHPRSGIIVAGHSDGTVAVWDPRISETLSVPTPAHHGQAIVGISVAPDGRSILSQAEDGVVCSTTLDTMRTALTLSGLGPVAGPSPPAFSPTGAHIVARGADSVFCWSSSSGERVCAHETPVPVCVSWEVPQVISAHRNGHAALWGTADGS